MQMLLSDGGVSSEQVFLNKIVDGAEILFDLLAATLVPIVCSDNTAKHISSASAVASVCQLVVGCFVIISANFKSSINNTVLIFRPLSHIKSLKLDHTQWPLRNSNIILW